MGRKPLAIVICPGYHSPTLTASFLRGLGWTSVPKPRVLVPDEKMSPIAGGALLGFIKTQVALCTPLLFISFSAGGIGALGAAHSWSQDGGVVKGMIVLDGWGLPVLGPFPQYRVSHDGFTHWSSALLGTGLDSFYADPPISHLDLWRSPQLAQGWRIHPVGMGLERRSPMTAAQFIQHQTNHQTHH